MILALFGCAAPAPERRPVRERVDDEPLNIVVVPADMPMDARRCTLALAYARDGAVVATPVVVESAGDVALDAACVQRGLVSRFAVPEPIAVPLAVRRRFWVAADGTTSQGSANGGLSRQEIQGVVDGGMVEIRNCFTRDKANVAGKVTLFWVIDSEGGVAAVATKDEIPPVGACVAHVVEKMRFPTPKGGGLVDVAYPFVFAWSAR